MIVVSVEDKGIGMTEQECFFAFTPFNRNKFKQDHNLNPYGNGIGLSICKEICENLDGEIYVDSTPGLGTTFTLKMRVYKNKN